MLSKRIHHVPHTTQELAIMVRAEIELHGPNVDLNHIDISQLTSLKEVFKDTKFNGNISQWNVSRIESMERLFTNCPFNGDISQWDTQSLVSAGHMFEGSVFNGDLSAWNTSSLIVASAMFRHSHFNGDISGWNTSRLSSMVSMFEDSAFNGDISKWDVAHALKDGQIGRVFDKTPYTGNLSSWMLGSLWSTHNAFGPEFKGILPRSTEPICKQFYVRLFGTSQRLHRYLRTQAFGGCHFDILRLADHQPEWAKKADYQWARQLAKTAQSIGMDDDALRTYAMALYHNRGSVCSNEFIYDVSMLASD